MDIARENCWVSWEIPAASATLFTDASDTGWGLVLSCGVQIIRYGEQWSDEEKKKHINCKEINAVSHAIEWLKLARTAIDLVDNTTACYAIGKMHSMSSEVATSISQLHAVLQNQNVYIAWIPSKENPADGPSRERSPLAVAWPGGSPPPTMPVVRRLGSSPLEGGEPRTKRNIAALLALALWSAQTLDMLLLAIGAKNTTEAKRVRSHCWACCAKGLGVWGVSRRSLLHLARWLRNEFARYASEAL